MLLEAMKNKGADQSVHECTADLRFCFTHMQSSSSRMMQFIKQPVCF